MENFKTFGFIVITLDQDLILYYSVENQMIQKNFTFGKFDFIKYEIENSLKIFGEEKFGLFKSSIENEELFFENSQDFNLFLEVVSPK